MASLAQRSARSLKRKLNVAPSRTFVTEGSQKLNSPSDWLEFQANRAQYKTLSTFHHFIIINISNKRCSRCYEQIWLNAETRNLVEAARLLPQARSQCYHVRSPSLWRTFRPFL